MVKFQLLLLSALFLFANNLSAWCFAGRGNTCPNQQNAYQNNGNIVSIAPYAPRPQNREDGGAKNKRLKGNKSDYQGYAEYREHFVFGTFGVFNTPHQNAKTSVGFENRSYAYEYSFNPFLSAKIERLDSLFQEGLEDGTSYQHEHYLAMALVRVYLLENLAFRFGGGIGESSVKEITPEKDTRRSGSTTVFQMSLYYIWGDEDTMIGLTQTVIEGQTDEQNLGVTSHGISFGVGF